jgi:ABC-2 type transport system permease protein
MRQRPSYLRVLLTFARNSLVRDILFRTNFVLQCVSSVSWTLMNVGFYLIIFSHTPMIGPESGWGKYEFFVFLATTWLINSLVQAFCMPNAEEFSELIRTGNLDFALLKPIDTQFLISFQRIEWSALSNFAAGLVLLVISLWQLTTRPETPLVLSAWSFLLYALYLCCGVAILYSLMIALASTSIWLGRNQTLYNFWFYITNFARYPMEIYQRGWGMPLWGFFTFVVPVLIVVNVPARILAQPLYPRRSLSVSLALFALVATVLSVWGARWVFQRALRSYRSASS